MNDFQRTDRDFAKLGSKLGCASHGEVFILRFIEKMFFFKESYKLENYLWPRFLEESEGRSIFLALIFFKVLETCSIKKEAST